MWLDLETIIQSEVSQKAKTNVIQYCLYVESRKTGTNKTYLQSRK